MNNRSFSLRTFVLLFSLTLSLPFYYRVIAYAGPCPDGTIAIWSLEESSQPYEDWINPSSNSAICDVQCPTPIDDGVVTGANRFNDGGLRVPGGAAFNWTGTDSFSIELWVRNTGAGTDQVLIGRADGTFSWSIFLLSNGAVGFGLNDSTASISLTGSKVLSTGQSSLGARWHHVAVVRNGDSGATQLFVDGQLADSATQTFPGGFSSDSASLGIGWSGDSGNPQRFNGDLDEVAVYQHPLTPADIRSHYYLARHYCELYDDLVNIMPLGNSITYDSNRSDTRPEGDRVAYRYPLWESLTAGNYLFDFVGNREAGFFIDPDFDPDNAGFPGITTSELLELLQTSFNHAPEPQAAGYYEGDVSSDTPYLPRYPNDVILLHIGTNAIAVENADDVDNILDHIDGYSTNVTVVVARIIHREDDFNNGVEIPNNLTNQFNNQVEQIVVQRITAGDKLLMVDMEDDAGIEYVVGVDMADDLHPNASGYAKMAAQWFVRLQEFLPQAELPEITSEPVTEAVAGEEYQYQVTASGSPPPRISLETAPDGMTIDENSGLITWTAPNTVGESVYVSIRAENIDPADASWARAATQNFSISIVQESSDGDGDGDGDGNNNDSSSSGGCFIQSTILDNKTQPVWGLVLGLLMFAGLIGTLRRIMK